MVNAVIFDVDGTLVDSVDLHAKSWVEAFAHFGKRVGFLEVRSQIGKGGDQLLPTFLSEEEIQRFGKELEEYRSSHFMTNDLPRVLPFPRVRALFQALRTRGVQIVLGSSGKPEELQHHVQLCNVSDLIDAATTRQDANQTKPHPDIFIAALEKLGRPDPRTVLVVGDSPYDAIAARRAGMRAIGLLSGGFPAGDLREAGCVALYEDPGALLDHLDSSPILAGSETGASTTPA